jgi:tetratricopeptide (TPR) repeat protein
VENQMVVKRIFIVLLFFSGYTFLNAATAFEEGEKLYLEKKVKDAIPMFEKALGEEPRNEKIYLYLSNSFEVLNEPQKSIDILEKGLRVARDTKSVMYYNLGNNYYTIGKYKLASEMYTQAITYKEDMEFAFLNRAQVYIQLIEYKSALSDYKHYLELAPDSPQKKEVEEIIRLLSQVLSDEEKAQLDKDAREKQLKDLIKSLEDAKDNSKDLQAGIETLKDDYTEGELLD